MRIAFARRRGLGQALRLPFLAALCLAALSGATARALEIAGFVGTELRLFPNTPSFVEQSDSVLELSLLLQPEFRKQLDDERGRLTFIPFARVDSRDSERTHFDVRELNWLRTGRRWDLTVGVDRVFWGVTESRHLVDVVNQTDLIENIDTEDKLGQPMVRLDLHRRWGTVSFFLLPLFRERTFPGETGRLRSGLTVDTGQAIYESSLKQWHPDLAIRWSHALADWDVGLSYFRGTGREPRLVPGQGPAGSDVLVPHYDVISQLGVEVQATKGRWLWKLEAMARQGQGESFVATVAGFEWTTSGVHGTRADVGVLLELLHDGRKSSAPTTALQDDVFLGTRLTLNDVNDTQLLGGILVDRKSGSAFVRIEAGRRLGSRWRLELEANVFANVDAEDALQAFRSDDYLQVHVARFF